ELLTSHSGLALIGALLNRYPFDNIFIGVTNYITANTGSTIDYDKDGYIDGMKVIFDKDISIGNIDISKFNISHLGVNVSNLTISGIINNELYLSYDDGLWDGGIIPDLGIISYTTDGGNITFSQVNTSSILESDGASPFVTISPNGSAFNTTQIVNLSINETGSIYYSNNGTIDLITQGIPYIGPITINTSTTIYYQGKDLSGNISTKQSANFTKYTDPNSGGGGGGGGGGGIIYQPIVITKPIDSADKPSNTGTDLKEFIDFETLKNQVYQVSNNSQIEIFNKLFPRIIELLGEVNNLPLIGTSLDKNRVNYYNYIKGFFINIFKYKNIGEEIYKINAKTYLNKLLKQESEIRNSYESIFYIQNGFLFPKSAKYNNTFILIQRALFNKYNGLLIKNIINNEELIELKTVYNNFVYSLIMYKNDKNINLKEYAKVQLKVILKYYEMK
ncbi:MAG: chitobiase/beta-hexosaminidase C-terminal domain-containing protein, partial [Candidatus Absconditabacteria bacterium]